MKLRRIEIVCVALIMLAGLVYLVASAPLAQAAATRWGAKILAGTDGNVADAKIFVQLRLRDAAMLFSLAAGLVLVHSLLSRLLLKPATSRNRRWIVHAVAGFILANVWLAVAMHLTLFWLLFWQGRADTAALARFRLKQCLLRENPATRKAVILGNSQARAQMDEPLLNSQLAPLLFTGELHFPGSRAFDIWLVHRHIEPAAAQVVVCYVSELSFYGDDPSVAAPSFFSFADWRAAGTIGTMRQVEPRKLGWGLFGDALPAFYIRDPLACRILGGGVGDIRQRQRDQIIKPGLANVALDAAGYQLSALSDFQKRAFAAFAADCAARNQTLVVIAGQLNPRLGSQINPAVREDMLAFLRGLRQRFPTVVLVDDYPAQAEPDYDDLTHVNKAQQEKFTKFIGERLRAVLTEPGPK